MKIKQGDIVQILAGKDRGKQGRIIEARPRDGRVLVENLNVMTRHTRPRPLRDANRMGGTQMCPGGRIEKAAPVDVSNVMLVCPVCNLPTRVGIKVKEVKGETIRVRVCKRDGCGQEVDRNGTTATYTPRLKERYLELRPQLQEELGLSSIMQVPEIAKITLNMGVGDAKTDAKALDAAIEELTTIAGQRAQVRKARKSIASFKLREGMAVGARVTLRGARMYEFLDRLVSVALPRIRDFRGLNPRSFDGRGNYSLGRPRADHLPGDRLRRGRVDPGSRRHDHDLGADDRRAGVRTPARPRASVRSRRQKGSVTHGQDVSRRQAEARAQVQGAQLHALQQVRPPARGVQEVRPLPDLPARARAQRLHPRHDEVSW